MRVVLDTNVLVSALLSPGRTAWRVLDSVRGRHLVPLYDARVLAEYRAVLGREKFPFTSEETNGAERLIRKLGEQVEAASLEIVCCPIRMISRFIEVAVAGRADALVTGNTKHFPAGCGVRVVSPRELADLLDG